MRGTVYQKRRPAFFNLDQSQQEEAHESDADESQQENTLNLERLQKFMLANMLESEKFNKIKPEIRAKYKNIILNQSQTLNERINLNEIFKAGDEIDEPTQNTLRKGVQFSFSKAQPQLIKYFETMMKKAEMFVDKYCFGPNIPFQNLNQDQIDFESWQKCFYNKQKEALTGGAEEFTAYSEERIGEDRGGRDSNRTSNQQSNSASPGRRRGTMRRSTNINNSLNWKEFCKNCKMQITQNKESIPVLENMSLNETLPVVDENSNTAKKPSFMDNKRQAYLKNREAIPEYDFMLNGAHVKKQNQTKEGKQNQNQSHHYHYVVADDFENVEERIEFLEEHKMSTKSVIMQDIKEQNKSIYQKFFFQRILRSLSSDCTFQAIIEDIEQNLILYLQSQNFQIKYQDRVKQELSKISKEKNVAVDSGNFIIEQQKQKEIERQEHLKLLDKEKLEQKVKELQEKIKDQNIKYFRELDVHRQMAYRIEKQTLEGSRVKDDYLNIQLFDEDNETLFIEKSSVEDQGAHLQPKIPVLDRHGSIEVYNDGTVDFGCNLTQNQKDAIIERLDDRLKRMDVKYSLTLNQNQRYIDELLKKIQIYKNLPMNYKFLASMDMAELMGYIAEIEQDPFIIYEKIEEVYRPNFFEGVIYKKFAHLFDENTEESFKAQIDEIRMMTKEQLSTYQVNLALHMDYHENQSNQLGDDLKEMEKQMEKQCEAIRKEERIKQNYVQFQTEQKMSSQFDIYKRACNEEIQILEEDKKNTEKQIVNISKKAFLFRWHIKTLMKRLQTAELQKAHGADHRDMVAIMAEIHSKAKHDSDAYVIKHLQPLQDKIKEQEKIIHDKKAVVIENIYEKRNLQKVNMELQKELANQKQLFIYTDHQLKWSQEKLETLRVSEIVERDENVNFRKIIDGLNKRIETLIQKLERLGVSKIPISEIEKKVFYSNNDKMLEQCNLVHEIHDQIRKSFNIAVPNKILQHKDLVGSYEYLISELKNQIMNNIRQNNPMGIAKPKEKKSSTIFSQTKLRDTRCDLIYKSTAIINGNEVTHDETQTEGVKKEFSDYSVITVMTIDDLFHLEENNLELKEQLKRVKEEKARLQDGLDRLKKQLSEKDDEIQAMRNSYIEKIKSQMKENMHGKFNKKRKGAKGLPLPTENKINKLQNAVSDVMKVNQDAKNDRKSKITTDAIKNRLGEKMRNLFSDAALQVKQRKKEKEEKEKLIKLQSIEQIPEKNINNMITLELQQKESTQEKVQFQESLECSPTYEDEEAYSMSPIPIQESRKMSSKLKTPGSDKIKQSSILNSTVKKQSYSHSASNSCDNLDHNNDLKSELKVNPVDINFNINPKVTLMTKIHKVQTAKTAKPKHIQGFSGIQASSSKPKLQKQKTQTVIRLKGRSVQKHHQSESKLSHKEIRNIETEDIQTQTPNIDNYEQSVSNAQKSYPKMNYDSNVDLFDQDLTGSISLGEMVNEIHLKNPLHGMGQKESRILQNHQQMKMKEKNEWVKKMAGNNTLDDKLAGMTIYQNKTNGRKYVHLNELKTQLSTKEFESVQCNQTFNNQAMVKYLNQNQQQRPSSHCGRQKVISRQLKMANSLHNKSEASIRPNKDISTVIEKPISANLQFKPVSRNTFFSNNCTRAQSATAGKIVQSQKDHKLPSKQDYQDLHYMDNQIQIFKNKRNASFSRNPQLNNNQLITSNSSAQTIYNTQEPQSIFGGLLSNERKKEQMQIINETTNGAYFNSTKHMTLGDFLQINSRVPPQKKTPKEMITQLKAQVAQQLKS